MKKAFTLIELFVVIAVIAILAVVVVLVLNPAQLLMQSRDSSRLSDAATLKNAIGLYSEDVGGSMGSSSVVYISIPDPSATTTAGDQCQGLGLLALASSTYHCAASSTYRTVNGLGWIPLNFSSTSVGSPIGSLPIDPINTSSTGYFYTYNTNTTQYELTMAFESSKNAPTEASDGGPYSDLYEVGTNLALAPVDFYNQATVGIAYITTGTVWSATTNGASITIEAIGGGGGGNEQGGGGGAEYCKSVVAYASGTSIPISIGQGGISGGGSQNGTQTTWNTSVVVAKGGTGGASGGGGGAGGTGTLCYNGGPGGNNGGPNGGNGGGGAGGPLGAGAAGAQPTGNGGGGGGGNGGGYAGVAGGAVNGGNGGNNIANNGGGLGNTGSGGTAGTNGGGGGGGYSFAVVGTSGGNGTEWSTAPTAYGSGGGGGGGSYQGSGAAGGLYGGGAGGGGYRSAGDTFGGPGGNGILVITYTP